MYEIDFTDSKALWKFGCETVNLAEKFQEARKEYGNAVKTFKLVLAKSYGEGKIKESLSEDKAYLVLTENNEELKKLLGNMVESQQLYKGLLKVVEARVALLNFSQSLMRNQPKV